ncbi:DUF7504 family protein [Halobellus sp. GM3]|uniref:DUF7504 family protein n=1 Tax=Halobellus sp. GM3 TaxID=3458410 RepID=UPI00403D6B8D
MFSSAVLESESILISGPSFSGKQSLFYTLLDEIATQPLVISTHYSSRQTRIDYAQAVGKQQDPPLVINCTPSQSSSNNETTPDNIEHVENVDNLTQVGTKFISFVQSHPGEDLAVGIYSLTPLLVYTASKEVYKFAHALLTQARAQEWPVIGVLDLGIYDEQTISTIQSLFDCSIRTALCDGGRKFQTRTRTGTTEWTSF